MLLRKSHTNDTLRGLKFLVVGLGDSSYQQYNFVAKKLYKRLLQLGADALLELGLGDDQHYLGLYGGLDPFLHEFKEKLLNLYPSPQGLDIIPEIELLEPSMRLIKCTNSEIVPCPPKFQKRLVLKQNVRLTAKDHFQDVRHLSIQIPDGMLYTPGDVLRVYPENDEQKVDELITILNWNDKKDTLFRIEDNQTRDGDIIVDTLRNVLLRFTEPLSVPRDRYFFELLSHFAVEEIHKQKLAEFGSSEGQEAMYEYCWRAKRTAFEIIKDFLPLKIPVEYAVELFSFMKGRDFSISSAPLNSNSLDVTVGVVEYKTILKDGRFGVCTPWLCRTLPLGQPFAGEIIKGQLRCMADANEPVIYIAAGLGIAPIRSIVQDRISKGCDKNVLFFGCRYRSKDYLYENEWNDYVSEGKLKLYCAFSRDGLSKVYVQHLMRENGSEIWELINSHHAHILLCGNSKNFPDDVDNALKTIFKTYGGYSQEDANLFLSKLIRSGRYQKETWSSK